MSVLGGGSGLAYRGDQAGKGGEVPCRVETVYFPYLCEKGESQDRSHSGYGLKESRLFRSSNLTAHPFVSFRYFLSDCKKQVEVANCGFTDTGASSRLSR